MNKAMLRNARPRKIRQSHYVRLIILLAATCALLILTGALPGSIPYFAERAEAGNMGLMSMTTVSVSFSITGGGVDYLLPVFSYVHNSTQRQYIMTQVPTGIQADVGSSWSVIFNPLGGSTALERWYAAQPTNGTIAAEQSIAIAYQHQYMLTVLATPTSGGTASPASAWENAGVGVGILATEARGYTFQYWRGSGAGNYTGFEAAASVTMGSAILETANFGGGGIMTNMTVSYAVTGGGSGYTAPIFNYFQAGTFKHYSMTTTPTGLLADPDSSWYVEYNPLAGSNALERWYTSETLDGIIASNQSLVFTFQHQYMLAMLVGASGGGSVLPVSAWQDAGSSIGIVATSAVNNQFQLWYGAGRGNYTGTNNPTSVTMNSAMIETAYFESSTGAVTMLVSFTVTGGGAGYSAPVISYVQNGTSRQYTLTGTVADIHPDSGSAWSVTPNPLTGSTNSSQWFSPVALNGTASAQVLIFTFQHQYLLTMLVNPAGAGSTVPITGWQNGGTPFQISATTNSGYVFVSWTGNGTSSYSGSSNPRSITMNGAVAETANFFLGVTMTVSYSVAGGGSPTTTPAFSYVQGGTGKQYALTGTPTGILCDTGSAWSVVPNPLGGSTLTEQWLSNDTLSGIAATQTLVFTFQQEYLLTMRVNPAGAGSTVPITGWQNAGMTVQMSAAANPGYNFTSWAGTGTGSYSGTNNPNSIVMNGTISETAAFIGVPIEVTMQVSYQIVGGGSGYTAPVFVYVSNGHDAQRTLTEAPASVQCDSNAPWYITVNPLTGSTASERWFSSQSMNGTASARSIVFSFQHQFTLTMNVSPSGGGLTAPATGWQNANSTVQLIATASQGYVFQSWTGSGASSYSGASNPASIIMNGVIGETAIFVFTIVSLPSGACRFANVASLEIPSTHYSFLRGNGLAPEQQILLPLSPILPASSLIANRRTRRRLLHRLAHGGGARGGLSGLTSVIVLVILMASAVIGMVAYYYSVSSGATQQPSLIFSDSAIKVNTTAGTGTVYIKMYNQGPGDVRIRSVNVASSSGNFGVDFSSGLYGMVSAPNCNCTISGGQSVGVGGSNGNGFIALPAGRTMAILVTFNMGMDAYFKPGTTYEATVIPVQAPEAHFNIPSQG